MIATDTTMKPTQYQDVFRGLAEALQDHLAPTNVNVQVDEAKARQIAQEAVEAAKLPRPLAVYVNDKLVAVLEGRQHYQFIDLMKFVV